MASSSTVKGEDLRKPPPADGVEDERTASGDEDASRTTLEVIDSTHDTSGETATKLSSVVEDKEIWAAAEIPDYPMNIKYVPAMEIFPDSSHRDGSIYSGTDDWKEDYFIADRNDSKGSITFPFFYLLLWICFKLYDHLIYFLLKP